MNWTDAAQALAIMSGTAALLMLTLAAALVIMGWRR